MSEGRLPIPQFYGSHCTPNKTNIIIINEINFLELLVFKGLIFKGQG